MNQSEAYQFCTDAGHGWLQVTVNEFMGSLRDGMGYSSFSYANVRTGMVYLEEDLDALTFIDWYKGKHGKALVYDVVDHGDNSWIRNLPSLRDTRN